MAGQLRRRKKASAIVALRTTSPRPWVWPPDGTLGARPGQAASGARKPWCASLNHTRYQHQHQQLHLLVSPSVDRDPPADRRLTCATRCRPSELVSAQPDPPAPPAKPNNTPSPSPSPSPSPIEPRPAPSDRRLSRNRPPLSSSPPSSSSLPNPSSFQRQVIPSRLRPGRLAGFSRSSTAFLDPSPASPPFALPPPPPLRLAPVDHAPRPGSPPASSIPSTALSPSSASEPPFSGRVVVSIASDKRKKNTLSSIPSSICHPCLEKQSPYPPPPPTRRYTTVENSRQR